MSQSTKQDRWTANACPNNPNDMKLIKPTLLTLETPQAWERDPENQYNVRNNQHDMEYVVFQNLINQETNLRHILSI